MFRLLTAADADAYYPVLHTGYQDIRHYPISFSAVDATEDDARRWLTVNPTYGLVVDGEIVSAMSLRMPWGPNPGPKGVPHLGWVCTREDRKQHGYSKELFHELEEEVLRKELKAPLITLGTAANHPWLKEMYESWGFVPFAEKQLPGKKHRTLFLEKVLK